MVSTRSKYGTGPFLKIYCCSNDFITQKVYFFAVNASLCSLNNVSGVLSPDFLDSYWSAGFRKFLKVLCLASHWLEDCANCTPTPEENDKCRLTLKHLTLLSQRKLALNAINTLFAP
jgi:hypothetical protein